MQNSKGLHDKELKEAEKRLELAKEELEKVAEESRENSHGMDGLQLEVAELGASVDTQTKQVKQLERERERENCACLQCMKLVTLRIYNLSLYFKSWICYDMLGYVQTRVYIM